MMKDIKLRVGYDTVKFGDSYSSVIAALGEPESVDHIESFYNDELTVLLAEYDGFSVYLEGDDYKRVTDFEVDGELAMLFGESLRDKNIDQIKEMMKKNKFVDFELENDGKERVLSYLDGLVDFSFEDGVLISVMWSIGRNIDFTPRW